MRKSPTMRPNSPSIGNAWIQRQCQGSNPSSAEVNVSSAKAPNIFGTGEFTGCDFHQRMPSIANVTGHKKTAMPKACNNKSPENAPAMPIQLCGACIEGLRPAVFSEGSSGEYEASARK